MHASKGEHARAEQLEPLSKGTKIEVCFPDRALDPCWYPAIVVEVSGQNIRYELEREAVRYVRRPRFHFWRRRAKPDVTYPQGIILLIKEFSPNWRRREAGA